MPPAPFMHLSPPKLMCTGMRSRHNGHGFMYAVAFLPFKRFIRIARQHTLLTSRRVELYKDIKGGHVVIHSAFQPNLLTRDCGQSNPYGEPAEGCLWVAASHLHQKENYISLTPNDCIFIAIVPPFILPLPLTDSSLYLQRWARNIVMLWVCVIR